MTEQPLSDNIKCPEFVPVMGGVLDGRRVRWQGPTLFAPVPVAPTAFRPADEPRGMMVVPPTQRYVTWRSEQGDCCYIEEETARQIEADRERASTLELLIEVLGEHVPDPGALQAVHMEGFVWWCGDEYCDCSQAQIVGWDEVLSGWRRGYRTLWDGSFHSDGESGIPNRELAACRRYLDLCAPTIAAQIRWAT